MMNTRDTLIDVAGRLFAERGYDGVSVRDIVREAHANLGAVTYHFDGKEGLFEAVIERKIKAMRQIGLEIAASAASPDEKLRGILEVYAMQVLHVDPSLKVLFAEMSCGSAQVPKIAVEGVKLRNRIFSDVLQDGIRKGIFRKCDVEFASRALFGMLSPYILHEPLTSHKGRLEPYSRAQVKRIVDAVIDVFMNGIRTCDGKRKAGRET